MIGAGDVTACLVTRGNIDMEPIVESLIFDSVIVWDNSREPFDAKCAGRYFAALKATSPVVYFQDDDVLVPAETQQQLLDAYEPETMVANWAHGDDPAGYDDLPLVGAGALVDWFLPWRSIGGYLARWPLDEAFLYEADFVVGVLYPQVKQLRLPFTINLQVAQAPSRLCNQPWQPDLKRQLTDRARQIRDEQAVPA